MALPESWSIKSRSHRCSVTDRHFEKDEPFYTAIFPDPESSGYIRRDFCLEAWNDRPADAEQPFSFWRSHYEPPVSDEKASVVAKESAEELLSRLIEEDEPHTENARYILAVMLERQKLLVETDNQHTPNGILRIYEHKKNGDVYIVRDPNIPLDQIESVQSEVAELLDGNRPRAEEQTASSEGTKSEQTSDEQTKEAAEATSETEEAQTESAESNSEESDSDETASSDEEE
ncbi:hypothetical protein Rhal01_01589 [Rubritalea halochordaticola]|uniref:Uncharacterized protein n=1 Tax=Rubritalea halochordaticola TaxID=714537 RepID=A0ABP9V0F0_9BACT